ncbi:unnamed protein product [Schistocephalus solidus]|uniref:C2H2-type domain-containing protein n=1 Tax=Schistocephalus solidus TaxID=70667 RepID=A0A183SE66_SCHSO|nr:unnamed protein product [Schistocephalus solidus]
MDENFAIIERDQMLAFKVHLNGVFQDIQFTMEKEENNQLAFLDLQTKQIRRRNWETTTHVNSQARGGSEEERHNSQAAVHATGPGHTFKFDEAKILARADNCPSTITDTFLPSPPLALITATNTTCPTPTISVATSDYLPPATTTTTTNTSNTTTNTTTATNTTTTTTTAATTNTTAPPSTGDGESVPICPNCDRTFTSHIGLVGQLRSHGLLVAT